MKNTSLFFLVSLGVILLFSCTKGKKNSLQPADFMIIGHMGGFVPYTSPFYKLTSSQLWEDTTKYDYTHPLPADFANLNFNYQLSSSKFDSVKDLLSSIPAELFGRNNTHIGGLFPDVGYTDVRASVNGVIYHWGFEADQSTSSTAIQQFVQRIKADY